MRVVLVTSSFLPLVGGMEYVIHYVAEELCRIGVDVTVLARRCGKANDFAHRYRLVRYGLPKGGHRLRIDHWTAQGQLAKLHAESPLNVAHIHGVAIAPQLVLPFLERERIPIVMTPHGEDVQRIQEIGYGLRLQPGWDALVRRTLLAADVVTAISDAIREEIDWVDDHRIVNIPNGIHVGVFGAGVSHYLQECLGLSPETRLIISVGRNHVKKGYEYGIRAAARLFADRVANGWCYVLIGRGVSALRPLVQQLSMESRIFLLENMAPNALKQCYNSSHIFFSPSIVEGLSLVSIEAMACGLPAVVTDVPGNRDVIRHSQSGILVRSKDTKDMERGLHELVVDDGRRTALASVAIARAVDYDWATIATQYLAVYERVTSSALSRNLHGNAISAQ